MIYQLHLSAAYHSKYKCIWGYFNIFRKAISILLLSLGCSQVNVNHPNFSLYSGDPSSFTSIKKKKIKSATQGFSF